MSYKKIRVIIPKNAEEKIALSNLVYAKHVKDEGASPLNALESDKWEVNGPNIETCLAYHNKAEDLRRQMEKAYEDRDALLDSIDNSLLASRDILLGVCRQNPKRIGEWGFVIRESRRAAKSSNAVTAAS